MNRTPNPDVSPCPVPAALPHPRYDQLCALLFGSGARDLELPPIADLTAALLALAEGKRRKSILALSSSTGELAFVRRGDEVLLSYYDSGPVPQIFLRDRVLSLRGLIAACAQAAAELAASGPIHERRTNLFVAERGRSALLSPDRQLPPLSVLRKGGAQAPREGSELLFGFSAQVPQGEPLAADASARADVHALLFDGELWAYAYARRVLLVRGPIYPAVARMVSAARAAVDAWESQRPLTLRLKAGDFSIGVRLSRAGEVALTLTGIQGGPITLAALDVPGALCPILRLGSDLARVVVSTDRAQSRNLRLCALRDEVRSLRRTIRTRSACKSFVNRDPELLRARNAQLGARERELGCVARAPGPSGAKLRLSLRWRAEVEGLDATSTFLCGDRIVVATSRAQLALSRESGELLWLRHTEAAASMMAGTSLVSVEHDGSVLLCDVRDGEVYARARVTPRVGGPMLGLCAGGRGTPPVAVIAEGRDRLVAIDTRTGEPRWRYRSRGRGDFRLTRAGRILLVVCGDSTLDALDVATGDVAWRWSDRGRIHLPASVTRDRALSVSGQPGAAHGTLSGFDLFSGQLLFQRELDGGPLASPVAGDQVGVVSSADGSGLSLRCFDLSGGQRWQRDDPGLGEGGAPLIVDRHLVINAPTGTATAIELASGETQWQQRLADPVRDDVPRRLEPILRAGALFLPSASVHVVRPADGVAIASPIAESIIPDFMRVDERGWLYLAEESGHVEAYAPAPSLRLVKG